MSDEFAKAENATAEALVCEVCALCEHASVIIREFLQTAMPIMEFLQTAMPIMEFLQTAMPIMEFLQTAMPIMEYANEYYCEIQKHATPNERRMMHHRKKRIRQKYYNRVKRRAVG